MRRVAVAAALACVALAGCRTLDGDAAIASVDSDAADTAQAARAQALGLSTGDCAQPGWSMAGRVGLSNGKDGGNGQFEWTQGAGRVRMLLSAPITRQTWVLEAGPDGATLQGVAGEPLHAADAATLLRDATGWEIPVSALGCWVRGVAADPARHGEATIGFGANLLPARIEQDGWVIDYSGWQQDPLSRLPMPSRIRAQRGEGWIRLAVDRWGLE